MTKKMFHKTQTNLYEQKNVRSDLINAIAKWTEDFWNRMEMNWHDVVWRLFFVGHMMMTN